MPFERPGVHTSEMGQLRPVHWLAIGVAAGAVAVALALPMYRCAPGYRFRDYSGQAGGGPTCLISDVGYRPHNWIPAKISVAVAGVVAAAAILLWRRRRLAAIGLIVVFSALVVAWFVPDGFEQSMRNGRPVCCGREISREWLRTAIAIAGVGIGAALIVVGVSRPRSKPSPAASGASRAAPT